MKRSPVALLSLLFGMGQAAADTVIDSVSHQASASAEATVSGVGLVNSAGPKPQVGLDQNLITGATAKCCGEVSGSSSAKELADSTGLHLVSQVK